MNPDNQQFQPNNNQQNYPPNNNQQSPRVVDSVMPPYQPNQNQNIQPNNFSGQTVPQPQTAFPQQDSTQPTGYVNTDPTQAINTQKPKKKSKLLFIFIAVIALLGLLTAAAVILAPKSNKSSQKDQQAQIQPNEDTTLSPAESINVEQTNSSINQDISGLNIEEDFPATQLDDKSLNL